MIIVFKSGAPALEIQTLEQTMRERGLTPEKIVGQHKIVIGLVGETAELDPDQIRDLSPWIESVLRVEKPYKRVSREFRHGEASRVEVQTPKGSVFLGRVNPWFLWRVPVQLKMKT